MYQNEKLDMRVKYTREWTFEALSRLLEVKEYENIKISEIIIKAGISRATFYRNFSTKDDIVKLKVKMFFEDFFLSLYDHFDKNNQKGETILIQQFFKRIDEEEKLVDVVIKTRLEYLMVEGILEVINHRKDQLYSLLTTDENIEAYTIEITASSAWTILSKWHRSGKEESSQELSDIFSSVFKTLYIVLFGDLDDLKD